MQKYVVCLLFSATLFVCVDITAADSRCKFSVGQLAGLAADITLYPVSLSVKLLAGFTPREIIRNDWYRLLGYVGFVTFVAPLADPTFEFDDGDDDTVDLDMSYKYKNKGTVKDWITGGDTGAMKTKLSRDDFLNPSSKDVQISNGFESVIYQLERLKKKGKKLRNLRIMGHSNVGYMGGGIGENLDLENLHKYEAQLSALAEDVMLPDSKIHLLGCLVAKGEKGQEFINEIQRVFGLKKGAVSGNTTLLASMPSVGTYRGADYIFPSRSIGAAVDLIYRIPGMRAVSDYEPVD